MRALQGDALDGTRGVAALLVVVSHLSLVGMHVTPGLDLAGIGKPGVYLFFVAAVVGIASASYFAIEKPLLRLASRGPRPLSPQPSR